jgi:hypothetical protein
MTEASHAPRRTTSPWPTVRSTPAIFAASPAGAVIVQPSQP